MPGRSSNDRNSRRGAALMLSVYRSDGGQDEVYVAPGLTIGRTVANTIVLAGDDAVDRTHARVEVGEDGVVWLRCVEPVSKMHVREETVRELILNDGATFRIGQTHFGCSCGREQVSGLGASNGVACPHCGSFNGELTDPRLQPCRECDRPLLPTVINPGSAPVLFPASYGRYLAERFVARGGMGVVLKGTSLPHNEPVALKVLLSEPNTDRQNPRVFAREVAAMSRVAHKNVVKLLAYGRSGHFPFLVMEWIDGPSLRQVIADSRQTGKLPEFATVLPWFHQVCKGLAAIHSKGLVHRDIKPSNILISAIGEAKIADFGIAKRVGLSQTSHTTTGYTPGTFEYMAPEQFSAPETVNGRADFYAVGVTFYEVLTGTRPVGSWPPASRINPTVPKSFDRIIARLLAPNAADRFDDFYELLAGPQRSFAGPQRSFHGNTARSLASRVADRFHNFYEFLCGPRLGRPSVPDTVKTSPTLDAVSQERGVQDKTSPAEGKESASEFGTFLGAAIAYFILRKAGLLPEWLMYIDRAVTKALQGSGDPDTKAGIRRP